MCRQSMFYVLAYGGLLIVTTIFMPRGVVPMVAAGVQRLTAKLNKRV